MRQIDMPLENVWARVGDTTGHGRFLRLALQMVLAGALVVVPGTARAEAPHYRVEFTAAKSLPACDREADFTSMLMPCKSRRSLLR